MTPVNFLATCAVLAILALTACSDDRSAPSEASRPPVVPATPEAAEVPDPRIRVELQVRAGRDDAWADTVRARPGQLLRFRAVVHNRGATARRTRAEVKLDRGLDVVTVSKYLRRTDVRGTALPLEPGLTRGGVVLGRLEPGTARLAFTARVAQSAPAPARLTAAAAVTWAQTGRAADTAAVTVRRAVRPDGQPSSR